VSFRPLFQSLLPAVAPRSLHAESAAAIAALPPDPCAVAGAARRAAVNGMRGEAHYRDLTSHIEVIEMTQRGWMVEGNVFCVLP
jgi:hypothetical protein